MTKGSTKGNVSSSRISRAEVRRATIAAVRDAKNGPMPLTLTRGQQRYIMRQR